MPVPLRHRPVLRALAPGLGASLAIVLAQETMALAGLRLPNPGALFFVAVVFATYAGGWQGGSAAALIAVGYTAGVMAILGPTAESTLRLAVFAPSMAAVVALVHVLRARAERALAAERALHRERARVAELENARRLGETLAVLDEVVWSTSVDGRRVLSVSPAAERFYGYPAQQFLAEPDLWQRVIMPEDRPGVLAALVQMETKGALDLEYRILRRDGAVRRVRDRVYLTRDFDGRPLRLDGVVADITAEREAQARLRRVTNLYAALSECNQTIVRVDSAEVLFREVCRIAVDYGGLRMAWIGRLADGRLKPVASFGASRHYLDGIDVAVVAAAGPGDKPAARAVRSGTHVVCNAIEFESAEAAWRGPALACGFRAAAALPIRENGEVVASLSLYAGEAGFFDDQLVKLLDEMVIDVSYALDRLQLEAGRVRMTEQLREAEERWQFALEGADTGVWDWNAVTGKVFYSTRWKSMIGHAEDEIGDRYEEWESRVHPDDLDHALTAIREHLDGRTPQLRAEHRLRCKDGSYRWILGQGRVMSRAEDGRALRAIGTHTDITALKEHEAALAESSARLRALFDNMEEGVALHELVRDERGRAVNYVIAAVNPRFTVLTGLRADQVEGRSGDAAYGTTAPPYLEVFAEVAAGGVPRRFETHFTPLGRHFSISALPWGRGGFATVFADITERKRAEAEILRLNAELEKRVAERTAQLAVSNRDLESFSYTVSHDLRAPLRAINGFASMLVELEAERLSAEGRGLLERVVSNTRKMSQLIDDILEYSRIGRAHLAPAPTDLKRLVDDLVADLRPAYPGAEIVVHELPQADVDQVMMRQVFSNLIGNALKFSAKVGLPRVEVGTRRTDAGLEYYVRDNGAGFDMRYADKLFGMFQRMHGAGEFPGTGVGLAIVKRLIERHGGCIRAEAEPGRGAVFHFTLGT